jgi:VCBS repeat protein
MTAVFLLFVASAFAANPIPAVVGPPVPQAVVPGSGAFTLKVYGANFVSGAVVNWNRSPRSTTFVSARELQAQILASDVATATAGYITVTNPPPGGGVSSASYAIVEVHKPTKTIAVGRPHVYLSNAGSRLAVLSDYNNDGILDFAADYGEEIKVFLGRGDGTFRPGSVVASNYYNSFGSIIASGDFNNDDNEDLLFAANTNGPPTQLQVNFGDGSGKFRFGARSSFQFENYPWGVGIGDFNRDGNLDATVAAAEPGYYLAVFLGNGQGTFKQGATYQDVGAYEVVPADFNGDGILDLIVLDSTSTGNLFIQLGNGDGTFQQPRLVDQNPLAGTCSLSADLWVTDFNGDGKADLAYCERDSNSGKIWVALGNGDGTFKKPASLTVDAYQGAFEFAVGDFNSDGKTDILANYFLANNLNKTETDLFLGNGDGTFQRKKIITLPGEPFYNSENGIVPADFNSDGLRDFISKAPGEFDVFIQK